MMKSLLQDYANYNYWANNRIIEALKPLTTDQLNQEHLGSFNTIHKNIAHVAAAENMWLQRLTLAPEPVFQNYNPLTSTDLFDKWLSESEGIVAYIGNLAEPELLSVLTFKNLQGVSYAHTRVECLMQVLNHSTYHRGQIINQMRLAGEIQVPQTDYILYKRTV